MGRELSLKDAAVAMEQRMASFYRELRDRVEDEEARELLSFLAREEDEHARTLADWAEEPTRTECLDQAFRCQRSPKTSHSRSVENQPF